MMESREQEALNAYLKLLAGKGAEESALQQRRDFLEHLFPAIAGMDATGNGYRAAVEGVLDTFDRHAWPFCLMTAREYFHFWISDFKSIAILSAEDGFDIDLVDWRPVDLDLKTLWHMLGHFKFSTVETWPLKTYALALRQSGASQTLVDMRIKLVKLLLIRLRDTPPGSSKHYRIAVDATVPLFAKPDTRRLFFAVVREFYYFWIGDPNVDRHVAVPSAATSYV